MMDLPVGSPTPRPQPHHRAPLAALPGQSLPGAPSPAAALRTAENATLVARFDVTEAMARFTVLLDEPLTGFAPGQYVSLGLRDGERLVQRPYSIASGAPRRGELEFFIRRVNGGELTPRLWARRLGSRLRVGPPRGLFTLQESDPRTHLMVSSGTGLGPFIAMLDALRRGSLQPGRPAPPRVVLLNGVSYQSELGYRDRLERWQRDGDWLTYVPTVSRPEHEWNVGWRGHRGRTEAILDAICEAHGLEPGGTVAYLCGNPDMIESSQRALARRGFPAEDVRAEQYQPAVRRVA